MPTYTATTKQDERGEWTGYVLKGSQLVASSPGHKNEAWAQAAAESALARLARRTK